MQWHARGDGYVFAMDSADGTYTAANIFENPLIDTRAGNILLRRDCSTCPLYAAGYALRGWAPNGLGHNLSSQLGPGTSAGGTWSIWPSDAPTTSMQLCIWDVVVETGNGDGDRARIAGFMVFDDGDIDWDGGNGIECRSVDSRGYTYDELTGGMVSLHGNDDTWETITVTFQSGIFSSSLSENDVIIDPDDDDTPALTVPISSTLPSMCSMPPDNFQVVEIYTGTCETLVPHVNLTVPTNLLPGFSNIWDGHIETTGVEVCPLFFDFVDIRLAGITVPSNRILLVILVGFVFRLFSKR